MINKDNAHQLAQHLREYLAVAEFLRANDLTENLDMTEWHGYNHECGTVLCMAGWHTELTWDNQQGEYDDRTFMDTCNHRVSDLSSIYEGTFVWSPLLYDRRPYAKIAQMLYGTDQGEGPEALEKLAKRATYLLFRCERMIEEAANAARPRRLRQDHSYLPFPSASPAVAA